LSFTSLRDSRCVFAYFLLLFDQRFAVADQRAFDEDWERARGPDCPSCRRETQRLVNGVCPNCQRRRDLENAKTTEYVAMALTYRVLPRRKARAASG